MLRSPRPQEFPTPRPGAAGGSWSRRLFQFLCFFLGCLFVADALVGERGLIDMLKARRQHDALAADVARLRSENARLREQARRLREDASAIEEVARGELGLMAPGEIVFMLQDEPPRRRR